MPGSPRSSARGAVRPGWRLSPALAALLVMAVCLAATLALLRPAPSRPLRPVLLTTSSWAPFAGPELEHNGPVTHLVDQVFRQAGYAPTIEFTTFPSALDRVASGESMGTFPFVSSSARASSLLISDPLLTFTYVLFFRTGEAPTSAAELGQRKVARIAGYEYWPELDRAVGTYIDMPTAQAAFTALLAGEIDIVPEGRSAGLAYLGGPDFAADSAAVDHLRGTEDWMQSEQSLHLMMRPSATSRRAMAAFNRSLAEFKASPDYAAVTEQVVTQRERVAMSRGEEWLRDAQGAPVARAPRGTTALVLAWPELGPATPPDALVEVKITSGPLQGRRGWLRLDAVEIVR